MARTAADPTAEAAEIGRAYFEAHGRRDLDTIAGLWEPGGTARIVGLTDLVAPHGIRDFFGGFDKAFPDFALEIVTITAQDERCAVQWRATGTFAGPESFQGMEPTGARIEIEGCDVLTIREGRVHALDAYLDGADLARQIGALPAQDSTAEQRMTKALNLRTRLASRVCDDPEEIAEGVWIVRGGVPRKGFNVYFVRDGDGVLMYDAGIRAMTNGLAAAGAGLGGLTRIVLGHSHIDHRGAAPGLRGVPVLCHPDEVSDAQSDGGMHYQRFAEVAAPARWVYPKLLASWDGGPVQIDGTLSDGDEIAGFRVVHVPGHAPGQIALWRESDRLALTSDTFYTIDSERFVRLREPTVPADATNLDTEQARESLRKLAALEPAAAWPGHGDPVTGDDVRARLERGASPA